MRWSKRGSATNLIEVITTNSGMTEDELLNPSYADPPDFSHGEYHQ